MYKYPWRRWLPARDQLVTGPIEVHLWVATSAVDTDFTAKLIDVYPPSAWYPQGYALNLTDSIDAGAPDPAGRVELELPAIRRESQHGGGDRAGAAAGVANNRCSNERGRESRVVLPGRADRVFQRWTLTPSLVPVLSVRLLEVPSIGAC
jgi:hypothetical protein